MGGRGKHRKKRHEHVPAYIAGDRWPAQQCIDLWVTCAECGRLLAWFDRSTRPDDPRNGELGYRRDHSQFFYIEDDQGEWIALQFTCHNCAPHSRVVPVLELERRIAAEWQPDRRHAKVLLLV